MKAIFILAVLLVFVSCSPKPDAGATNLNAEATSGDGAAVEQKARAYLQPLLHIGESPTNLIERFGAPVFKSETPSNELCLTFRFSIHNQAAHNAGVGGFDAFFVSNRLTRWGPTYRSGGFVSPPPESLMSSNEVFKLFIASESLSNLLKQLDSNGAANASGLKILPDLSFEAQMLVQSDVGSSPTNTIVTLITHDQVVPKLESLTERNIGNRIVIVCRNQVIAAPVIIMPIATNEFQFPVRDPEFLRRFKE